MKKLFIATALLIGGTNVKAQTEKGSKMIGISAIGQNMNWGYYRNPQITIAPSFQYFVANNFSITSELALGFSKQKEYSYANRKSSYEFIVGIKQYFGSKSLKPFLFGGIGFGKQSEEYTNIYHQNIVLSSNTYTNKFLHISAQLGTGVLYSPSKFISIETSIGLNYRDGINESTGGYYYYVAPDQYNHQYLSSYISPFVKIGLQINLPIKKKD